MPQTIDNFFAMDILRFYKVKTIGKSKTTQRKYRYNLYELREIFELENVKSWKECDL